MTVLEGMSSWLKVSEQYQGISLNKEELIDVEREKQNAYMHCFILLFS